MQITKKLSTVTAIAAHALAALAIVTLVAGPAPVAAQTPIVPVSKAVLTISTSAVGLSSALLSPASIAPAFVTRCEFTVETSDVRYYYTGDTPTGSLGHLWWLNGTYSLTGSQALRLFREIRSSTASADATLTVSCWK
jgi:hypothetical protein